MIIEARYQMPRLESGSLHRLLRIQSVFDHVQKHLKERLVLIVAARRRHRQIRLPIGMRYDRRTQRDAWTLASGKLVRVALDKNKLLPARRQRNARIARDHARQP